MKIVGITYAGKADVYNMEVEDTHDYVVEGGIVAHNCYDSLRYACMRHIIPARAMHKPKPKGDDPLDLYK